MIGIRVIDSPVLDQFEFRAGGPPFRVRAHDVVNPDRLSVVQVEVRSPPSARVGGQIDSHRRDTRVQRLAAIGIEVSRDYDRCPLVQAGDKLGKLDELSLADGCVVTAAIFGLQVSIHCEYPLAVALQADYQGAFAAEPVAFPDFPGRRARDVAMKLRLPVHDPSA